MSVASASCFSGVILFCRCIIVSYRQHNDESSEASDWLKSLRQAQKAFCDWLDVVLPSFLVLAVAAL